MNVCILFDTTPGPFGGANQFLKTLTKELNDRGHIVTSRPTKQTDVVLLNGFNYGPNKLQKPSKIAQLRHTGNFNVFGGWLSEEYWSKKDRRGPAIVHRLDGVAELVRGTRGPADDVQPAVNKYADFTIFQTDYCRISFDDHSGVVPEHFTVINNAVNGEVFRPVSNETIESTPDTIKFVAVSWSANVRKGFQILSDLSLLPGVEVAFAGNWAEQIPVNNVQLAGTLDSENLAVLMQESDALVHAALNEPCANVIVEGMATVLPVLYRDSGGNRELAGDYGVELTDDLESDLARFRDRFPELKQRLLSNRSSFLIPRVVEDYISAFERAVEIRNSGSVVVG